MRLAFRGMMAPTFTPLRQDGSLCLDVIKPYAKHLKKGGVTGVWVGGTSGEGMSLTVAERKALAEAWITCRNEVPTMILQCTAGCLKDTQELARHAEEHGANGVAVLPCLFDPPRSTDDLVDYMEEVAKACPKTPLFYYHIPMKTGVNLSMSEFLQKGVARLPTLSGIKFTDFDVSGEGKKCLDVDGGSLTIFSGFDQTLQEALSLGFTCAVNSSFNFVPQLTTRIFSLMAAGNVDEARALQGTLTGYFDLIARHGSMGVSVAHLKATCEALTGMPLGPTRLPLKPLKKEATLALRKDLEQQGLKVC